MNDKNKQKTCLKSRLNQLGVETEMIRKYDDGQSHVCESIL